MTPENTLTVFVIDDDAAVRASIQGLLKSVGLRSEAFGTAQEFLQRSGRTGQVALFWTSDFLESTVWTFSASWLTPASRFPSSSSPVMETFR